MVKALPCPRHRWSGRIFSTCLGDFGCPTGATHWIGTYTAGAPETLRYLDRLGRERQSWVRNFADSGFIRVRTEYDERGHKMYISRPFDPAAGETGLLGTRNLSFDALVQSKEQDQANGTILVTSYVYEGLKTRIVAGSPPEKYRIHDGLGRLNAITNLGGFSPYSLSVNRRGEINRGSDNVAILTKTG